MCHYIPENFYYYILGDAYTIAKTMHTKYRNVVDIQFFRKYAMECKMRNNTEDAWERKYGPDLNKHVRTRKHTMNL